LRLTLENIFDWIWYHPNPVKWLLWPFGVIYRVAAKRRRQQFQLGIKAVTTLPVPVIVVGNISVGGTGKTPFVIWLTTALKTRGYRVGIVSRGYGGTATEWPQQVLSASDPALVGDEPVLLARATGCPVVVGPDRVAAAQKLLITEEINVIVSDDGLQHYALNRSAEIAVVDGKRGLGNGFCLPAGPLREPAGRINEMDAVVVNGAGWGSEDVFRATVVAGCPYQVAGSGQKPLQEFRGATVHAVAGIANPVRFFDLLIAAGITVIPHPLPDHAKIDAATLDRDDSYPVMVTEKDAVKCQSFAHENVWGVPIELSFTPDDTERLMQRILVKLNTETNIKTGTETETETDIDTDTKIETETKTLGNS
jgi:tetraacyldisaccharide 4'-kinase